MESDDFFHEHYSFKMNIRVIWDLCDEGRRGGGGEGWGVLIFNKRENTRENPILLPVGCFFLNRAQSKRVLIMQF